MASTGSPALYDDLLDVLAEAADAERLLAFRLSPAMQLRLEQLLEKSREGTISAPEEAELDEFERVEHLVRLLKARLLQRQEG